MNDHRLRGACAARVVAIFLAGLAALPAWAQELERFDGHKLVRVAVRSQADLDRMRAISEDHWSCCVGIGGNIPFRVPPEKMAELAASGLDYKVIREDVQALIDAERAPIAPRGNSFFDIYHNLADTNAYVASLAALRPDLATTVVVGNSLEGRPINGLRITGPGDATNRPAILFNGCQHAREWVAVKTPIYIADRLIRDYDTDSRLADLVDQFVFYIVPIVNPDGYNYTWTNTRLWRKNRRNNGNGTFGVDTNRNWGVGWGLDSGSSGNGASETYRGTAPFSEPETQVLRNFIIARPQIAAHIDFHSYSQLILWPWGYQPTDPPAPDDGVFDELGLAMQSAIAGVHGENYVAGPIGSTLYLASGGMVDWAYGDRGIWSFTIELRPDDPNIGFLLPEPEILPTCEENLEASVALVESLRAGLTISFPTGVPELIAPNASASFGVLATPLLPGASASGVTMYRRVTPGGGFVPIALAPLGGDLFGATFPPRPCGTTYEFYFEATSSLGATARSPSDAPASMYVAEVASETVAFSDAFETNLGWSAAAGDDTATSGRWTRSDPEPTAAQPGDDHSVPGTLCYVTDGRAGGSIGEFDVDNGKTTLTTPAIAVAGVSHPAVRYWLWYSNNAGSGANTDTFVVDLSVDGGAWGNLLTVGPSGPGTGGGWNEYSHDLTAAAAGGSSVRLRFVASDGAPGSIVEAAVDDFALIGVSCGSAEPCLADLDGSGSRGLSDLSRLLASFGLCADDAGFDTAADLDASECVNLSDLAMMLGVFGLDCPN